MPYDPFLRGPYPAGVRTSEARDASRNRLFPCEIWYPATADHAGQDLSSATQDSFTPPFGAPRRQLAVRDPAPERGAWPLVVFSHSSGGGRRQSTFLCTHLASHGYVVAALDHSEVIAPELARKDGETAEQKAARMDAWIANRVPDVSLLFNHLLNGQPPVAHLQLDPARTAIVGHSFGGWTALAAPDVEPRIRAVVALAPAGSSLVKPGMIDAKLSFHWGREIPTMLLAAENDASLPLEGMYELFSRIPSAKRMLILRRADHMHFMDDAEQLHEAVRAMPFTGELAWLPTEMRPISELCSGEQAHLFVRGLTLAHLDAVLKQHEDARRFLRGDVAVELARRGVEAFTPETPPPPGRDESRPPVAASFPANRGGLPG